MIKLLYALFFICWLNPAYANKILDQFFKNTQNFQANFTQKVTNNNGKVLEKSKGQLIMSRPNKFVLAYDSPAEQKYISNGKTIWIYDIELEQVSIKELDESIGDSPALLLSSNNNVYKHYDVSNISEQQHKNLDKINRIELQAKKEEMTFEKVFLTFDASFLVKMVMYDSFGQVTQLHFSDIQVNKPFALSTFNFVAPEGVDVIGNTSTQ